MHVAIAPQSRLAALLSSAVIAAGCGSGGGGAPPPPPPPNLAGVWAGTWQGIDPALGQVGGTFEAVLSQSDSSLTGPVSLLGDVDCIAGHAVGGRDAQDHLSGTLDRSPCQLNQWMLTAIDTAAETATGYGPPASGLAKYPWIRMCPPVCIAYGGPASAHVASLLESK